MVPTKSLDNGEVIVALCTDVYHSLLGESTTPRLLRLTAAKLRRRYSREGAGFLTKTLPRLGKSLDRALTGEVPFDSTGFRKRTNSQIPKLFGELFERVFASDGWVLPTPCMQSIRSLRELLFVYYKYELPYNEMLDSKVVSAFKKAETEVEQYSRQLVETLQKDPSSHLAVRINEVKRLLNRVFSNFDVNDIVPRHGPGAVSTGEKRQHKYRFTRINPRVASVYNWDEFYFASLTHVCDQVSYFKDTVCEDAPARVILVPKDSRGPRLISCEPLEIQWIQQGVMRALIRYIERNPFTRGHVNFTDQQPNKRAALRGSLTGELATLDLKEASDRVSLELIKQVFPPHLVQVLVNTRSLATILPTGELLPLNKFAPMGSALCFPIMASLIWAILYTAGDAQFRKELLVYGDDVIVPTEQSDNAIKQLELFGLSVNRDKSCTSGLFRESCGMDAYNGIDVTPVRIRTVWSSIPAADTYTSWLATANSMYVHGYVRTARYIADELVKVYRSIPSGNGSESYPHLLFDVVHNEPPKKRWNRHLQKMETRVLVSEAVTTKEEMNGWSRLLRYFTETNGQELQPFFHKSRSPSLADRFIYPTAKDTAEYTWRKRNKLRVRWR